MTKIITFNTDELAILTYALMFARESMAEEGKPEFDKLITKIEQTKYTLEKTKLTKRNKRNKLNK